MYLYIHICIGSTNRPGLFSRLPTERNASQKRGKSNELVEKSDELSLFSFAKRQKTALNCLFSRSQKRETSNALVQEREKSDEMSLFSFA